MSAERAREWSALRSFGGSEASTASRASSCRNATHSPSVGSIPEARHSSRLSAESGVSFSSSQSSACTGSTAIVSRSPRPRVLRRAMRASTASRTVSGSSAPPAASASLTKNGFPPVFRYRSPASTPWSAASAATACSRQGLDRDPCRPAAGRHLAEQNPEGVSPVELVITVGRNQKHGQRIDAAGDDPEDVEGRLVGPVHVLEHDDARPTLVQLGHERSGELVRPRGGRRHACQLAAYRTCDVEERAERARSEERVTGALEDAAGLVVAEAAHERRLAGARLSAHEHQPATTARR